jgi:hypothetical protein
MLNCTWKYLSVKIRFAKINVNIEIDVLDVEL